MIVETRVDGVGETIAAVERVQAAIKRGTSLDIGRRLAQEGLRMVRTLTPRQRSTSRPASSQRGFEPLFRQWHVVEQMVRLTAYRAIIRNRAVSSGGLAILASVEAGARAHEIPRPGELSLMVWDEETTPRVFLGRKGTTRTRIEDRFLRRGETGIVITKKVKHPGHRPFRMVQRTRRHLQRVAAIVLRQFGAQIEAEFGRGGLTVSIR